MDSGDQRIWEKLDDAIEGINKNNLLIEKVMGQMETMKTNASNTEIINALHRQGTDKTVQGIEDKLTKLEADVSIIKTAYVKATVVFGAVATVGVLFLSVIQGWIHKILRLG